MNNKANAVFWIGLILIMLNFWISGQSTSFWQGFTSGGPTTPPIGGGSSGGIPVWPFLGITSLLSTTPPPKTGGGGKKKKSGGQTTQQLLNSGGIQLMADHTPLGSKVAPGIVNTSNGYAPPLSGTGIGSPMERIYNALRDAGLTPIAAAGVLGNIQRETNPNSRGLTGAIENQTGDSGLSWGLIQWHLPGLRSTFIQQEGTQPVTGNTSLDFKHQIDAIIKTYRSSGIQGSSPSQIASSWAARVEQCQTCQPGQYENVQRMAAAGNIWQEIVAGQWERKRTARKAPAKVSGFPGGYHKWAFGGGWQQYWANLNKKHTTTRKPAAHVPQVKKTGVHGKYA